MKTLSSLAVCLIVATAAAAELLDEKNGDQKVLEMLVGKWEVVDVEMRGSSFEFGKDGSLKLSLKLGDKTIDMEGKYELLSSESFKMTLKGPDGKEKTGTIKMKLDKTGLMLSGPDDKPLKLTKK